MTEHRKFPGFSSPASGPEAPLDMLSACHERMQRQCATLRRLVPYLGNHGTDNQVREAAQSVVRYFDTSAPAHHADEEQDLFPALLESMAGSDAVCLRDITGSLAREHRELEAAWRSLRPSLQGIASGGAATLDEAEVEAFVARSLAHITREESELLPMAARLLSDDELARIGTAMGARRGLMV